MSNDLNLCQFIGRLGADPETRYMQNGDPVTNIRLATSESWKDKATGEKKEVTEWVLCTAFGKLAEIITKYCHKGDQIYASGRLKTEKYTDKSGVERYSTKIVIDRMQMLGGKAQAAEKPKAKAAPADDIDPNDIPF